MYHHLLSCFLVLLVTESLPNIIFLYVYTNNKMFMWKCHKSYNLFYVLIHSKHLQAFYIKVWILVQWNVHVLQHLFYCLKIYVCQKKYDLTLIFKKKFNSFIWQRITNYVQVAVCSQITRVNTPSCYIINNNNHSCWFCWFRVVWGWTRLSGWPVSSSSNIRTSTACEKRARARLESRTAPATRGHVYLANTFLLGSVTSCTKRNDSTKST